MALLYSRPAVHTSFDTIRDDPKLKKVFDSPVPAVVIFPVSHPVGLSVIRCMREQPAPIVAVDFKPRSAGLFSREVTSLLVPHLYRDAETFMEGMLAIGKCFRERPVLFMVDDEDVFLSLKHQREFERYYRLPLSPWDIVEPIVDKGHLYRTCQKAGFPIPTTWFVSSLEDLDRQRSEIEFPCIVKPTYSTAFRQKFGVKAKRFDSFEPLREFGKTVSEAKIDYVVQRFIEGPADELYTYAAYSDDNGEVVAGFMGRKLHQFPPDFGTCRLGESLDDPELERTGKWLLKILRYRGISLTEFKRDGDGTFRLMELNPRPGDWPEHLSYRCGANLVTAAYRACVGLPQQSRRITKFGRKWANLAEDMYYSVRGYKLFGYPEAHRGLIGWLGDVRGLTADAFFSWRDPVPAIVRFRGMWRDFARREREWKTVGKIS
ncbi:MAG: hypothetical protein FJ317_03970 [SAR202 cluster bacterium]|nr:hypothetical protein [SAR202 cluster bacterium]